MRDARGKQNRDAAVPAVVRKILENAIVMPVNLLGAKTIRLG